MEIKFGNESVDYKGPILNRIFTDNSYRMTFAPFQTKTTRFNLAKYYNLTRPGVYTVRYLFKSNNPKNLAVYLGKDTPLSGRNQPTSWGIFPRLFGSVWKLVKVASSNSMNITILENDIPAKDYLGF